MSPKESSLYLKQIPVGPMENYAYLVGCRQTKEAFIIDPGWDAKKMLREAKKHGLKVSGILLTHFHYDHSNAVKDVLQSDACPVYIHSEDKAYLGFKTEHITSLSDGQIVKMGTIEVLAIHTPGHSPGSQCFLTEGQLFTGDTLFFGACGRCDLPGGDEKAMRKSLQRLRQLEDSVILWPGHQYGHSETATLGEEKKNNPFLIF